MDKTNEGGIKNVAVSNGIKNGNAEVFTIQEHFTGNANAGRLLYNVDGNPAPRFPELAVKSAGFIDESGCPHPMYLEPDENTDGNGFDEFGAHTPSISLAFGRG